MTMIRVVQSVLRITFIEDIVQILMADTKKTDNKICISVVQNCERIVLKPFFSEKLTKFHSFRYPT